MTMPYVIIICIIYAFKIISIGSDYELLLWYEHQQQSIATVARFQAMLLGRMKPEELPAMHVVLHLDLVWQIDARQDKIRQIWM